MHALSSPADPARRFADLHRAPAPPLLLANVWDACSAVLMYGLGATAIATTSAGLAWALGYPDGDALPMDEHVAAIGRIARVVPLPITVDAEGGYSSSPQQAADNVMRLVQAGAVGINLEDGTAAPEVLCRKIDAIQNAAARAGVALFVNARTDVFLKALMPGGEVAECLRRGRLYAAAGANGLFVPAVTAAADIAALVDGQALPLNVMARPALPPLAELARLGVRRVSAGSAIAQSVWGQAQRLGQGFLEHGSTDALFAGAAVFGDINTRLQAMQAASARS